MIKINNSFKWMVPLLTLFLSCKEDNPVIRPKTLRPNHVVIISVDAPAEYKHLMAQDSVGKQILDSTGPYGMIPQNGFTYMDHMNNERKWIPKPNTRDTLTIETYSKFLELSTHNFFTSLKETFLIQNGDTVIITYSNLIPEAKVTNRKVNPVELNYNKFRLNKLFKNKYTSHFLVFGNLLVEEGIEDFDQRSIDYYLKAKEDYLRELALLDSLYQTSTISKENFDYRKDALDMLMESHKKVKAISKWLEQNQSLQDREKLKKPLQFDLASSDSLMKFTFFRDYLDQISKYGLQRITENNGGSGGTYIDSRTRFDSILADERFNQTTKNHLLFKSFEGIGQNFKVKDKEVYFQKLQQFTTNPEKLKEFQKKYNLDFSKSDMLLLTNLANDTLTYNEVLQKNKGKWLYIDFWASWCKPCLENMPASIELKKSFEGKNIDFIYISSYDQKENWRNAIKKFGIGDSQHYFIENGNVSKVIEKLQVETIPHYLIYDPKGNLINGYAARPGQGAKEQLQVLYDRIRS